MWVTKNLIVDSMHKSVKHLYYRNLDAGKIVDKRVNSTSTVPLVLYNHQTAALFETSDLKSSV